MTQRLAETVAQRVKALRRQTGLSAAQLAEAMTDLGVPWKREVVANLESGRRGKLDVDELVALAVVLNTPPALLLVDPTTGTTALTPDVEVPTAVVLSWMVGEQSLANISDTYAYSRMATPLRLVRRLQDAVDRCQQAQAVRRKDESMLARGEGDRERLEERLRLYERELTAALHELDAVLQQMRTAGMARPPLEGQAQLEALAAERGFQLEEWTGGSDG